MVDIDIGEEKLRKLIKKEAKNESAQEEQREMEIETEKKKGIAKGKKLYKFLKGNKSDYDNYDR